MKTLLIALGALSLLTAPVYANGDDGEEISDGIWLYQVPKKSPQRICHTFNDDKMVCNGPVALPADPDRKPPSNCGWNNKRGRYVCW